MLRRHTSQLPKILWYLHTKFTPDSGFGIAESGVKKHDAQSILSLVGKDDLIQTSAQNNYEISYKDCFEEKFLPCTEISKWQTIKIDGDSGNVSVSEEPNDFLREHPIMKEVIFEEPPDVLVPAGCTDARLHDIEFFDT